MANQGKKKKKENKVLRTRKSQNQKEALWELYKRLNGIPPNKDETKILAVELSLKPHQIYKWFWDTRKKVDEDAQLAFQLDKN